MLHPEARALLRLMEDLGIPPMETLTPVEARRFYYERRRASQPTPPEVGSVEELAATGPGGSIAMRLYRPLSPSAKEAVRPLPVLVYFHGGGWTIGDLDTHDTLCRELANGSQCAIVAVDYRMGPEHRFPAAVDDCIFATRWVHAHANELGLDSSRIGVGGDSAGANLAAVVCIAARDSNGPPILFQLLIYPATDMRRLAPSHTSNGEGYLLTAKTIAWFHDQYIDDPADDVDWRASPLLCADLSRLPRAFVLTAGFDPLRDEGLMYADKLSASGSVACSICFDRQIHGFVLMGRVINEANVAVSLCADQIRSALNASQI